MSEERILRIPRSDNEGEFILVNVSSQGSSSLDVKLLATESESPYVTNIKSSRTGKLLAKSSPVDQEQWEAILRHTLLQERLDFKHQETLKDLEVLATVAGDHITIIFRKNISQIHQRLGEIILKKDEEEEIDSISWVSTAVLRGDHLQDQVSDLQTKYEDQTETIKKLNQQLEELIQAKKEHEISLFQKFRELLNEKKLKIRDQQRLLATSKVDRETANQIRTARNPSGSTSTSPAKPTKTAPLPSRARKRKQPPTAVKSESEDDGGFEEMEVDKPGEPNEDEDEDIPPAETPSQSDLDETEDEEDADSEDLDAPAPAPTRTTKGQAKKGGVRSKGKAVEKSTPSKAKQKQEEILKKVASPPPRRELPFSNSGANGRVTRASDGQAKEGNREMGTKAAEGVVVDEDEETDDEEL